MGKRKPIRPDSWDQTRPLDGKWTKLERRGDYIVLAEPSNSTATEMRHDYGQLYWSARQFGQWVSQIRDDHGTPTLTEAKRAFSGTILVGERSEKELVPYVTDAELEKQIAHPQAASSFAEEVVIRRWGVSKATGLTYLHHRKPRTKPKKF